MCWQSDWATARTLPLSKPPSAAAAQTASKGLPTLYTNTTAENDHRAADGTQLLRVGPCWQAPYLIEDAHDDYINDVAYCADSDVFATCSADKTLKVWSLGTQRLQGTLEGHTGEVFKVVWNAVLDVWSVRRCPHGLQLRSLWR